MSRMYARQEQGAATAASSNPALALSLPAHCPPLVVVQIDLTAELTVQLLQRQHPLSARDDNSYAELLGAGDDENASVQPT